MSYLNIKANMPLPGQVCFISSICRSRCSLNFSINLTFEKQKLNSTFTQSWQCGVAKKVSKCSKHSYISMCIWLIKDRLKLTSVLGVTTIRSLSCEQMQVLRTRKTNYSQFKCRIFSPLALSAATQSVLIIFPVDSNLSQ